MQLAKRLTLSHCFVAILLLLQFSLMGQQAVVEEHQIVVKLKMSSSKLSRTQQDLFAQLGNVKTKVVLEREASFEKRGVFGAESIILKLDLPDDISIEEAIRKLSVDPRVEYAEPVYKHQLLYKPNDTQEPEVDLHWGHENARIYEAWDNNFGDPDMVIGIVDAGVLVTHPYLKNNLKFNDAERYGVAGVDDDGNGYVDDSVGYNVADDNAFVVNYRVHHGTEVAGIIGAPLNDSAGTFGVAPNCKVLPVKVAVEHTGFLTNTYEGILYAARNGCKIINLSWGRGGGGISRYELDIIDYVVETYDVLLVAAAGNTNAKIDFYPASYRNVVSVAHINQTNEVIATYSPFIDLSAPGFRLPSTNQRAANNFHNLVTGSSFASPFVAGAGALLWNAYPSLKAGQVAEILRQSANPDLYSVPANAIKQDLAGTGRLDALDAMTNPLDDYGVRLKTWEVTNRSGESLISQDMQLTIDAEFINYLKPTESGFKVTVSVDMADIELLDTLLEIGEMATLDEASGSFRAVVPVNAALGQALFEFTYHYDNGKIDKEYIPVDILPSYGGYSFNDLELTVDANGRLGYTDDGTFIRGLGVSRNGTALLGLKTVSALDEGSAGIVISKNKTSVASSLYESSAARSSDFSPVIPTVYTEPRLNASELSGVFTDRFSTNPIGVDVAYSVHGNSLDAYSKFVIASYEVENTGSEDLDSLKLGFFADWDLQGGENKAYWDDAHNMAVCISEDSSNVVAIKVFANQPLYGSMLINQPFGGIDFTDGFSKSEKYQLLTAGNQAVLTGDVAQMVGAQLPPLVQGDSSDLYYAILSTDNIDSLDNICKNAKQYLMDSILGDAIPLAVISDSVFCELSELAIRPSNSSFFRFYSDEALSSLVGEGAELMLSITDTAKFYYVTNVRYGIESEAIKVRVFYKGEDASFTVVNDTVNLYVDEELQADAVSVSATSYQWNLGDGTNSSGKALSHLYSGVGEFDISLTVTNTNCTNVSTRKIVVIDEPPVWSVSDLEGYLKVYPNPANQELHLDVLSTEYDEMTVTVYNMTGKRMMASQLSKSSANNSFDFNLSGLDSGLYVVKIEINGVSIDKRILVVSE